MKRNAFRVFTVCLLLVMMLFVSCKAEPETVLPNVGDTEDGQETNTLVGRWIASVDGSEVIYEFTEYGTFFLHHSMDGDNMNALPEGMMEVVPGFYEIIGNKDVFISGDQFAMHWGYRIDGNKLTLIQLDENGEETSLTQDFVNLDKKPETGNRYIDEAIIGAWESEIQEDRAYAIFEFTDSGYLLIHSEQKLDPSVDARLSLMMVEEFIMDESKPGHIGFTGMSYEYEILESGNLSMTLTEEGGTKEIHEFTPVKEDSLDLEEVAGTYLAVDAETGETVKACIIGEDGTFFMMGPDTDPLGLFIMNITEEKIDVVGYTPLDTFNVAKNVITIKDGSLFYAGIELRKTEDAKMLPVDHYVTPPDLDHLGVEILFEDDNYTIMDNGVEIEEGKYSIIGNKIYAGDNVFDFRVHSEGDYWFTYLYWEGEGKVLYSIGLFI